MNRLALWQLLKALEIEAELKENAKNTQNKY